MIFLKPNVDLVIIRDRLTLMETAGRICYKSEEHIGKKEPIDFINRIYNRGHLSVLEHGSVYIEFNKKAKFDIKDEKIIDEIIEISNSKWSDVIKGRYSDRIYTNMRVIAENAKILYKIILNKEKLPSFLHYFTPELTDNFNRVSVKFMVNRVTADSFMRHTTLSPSCESSRFCKYAADKFDNSVRYIIPSWLEELKPDKYEISTCGTYFYGEDEGSIYSQEGSPKIFYYLFGAYSAEKTYNKLLELGCPTDHARDKLDFSTKSELILTGNLKNWKHFLKLRTNKDAQADAIVISTQLKNLLINRGYIKYNFQTEKDDLPF